MAGVELRPVAIGAADPLWAGAVGAALTGVGIDVIAVVGAPLDVPTLGVAVVILGRSPGGSAGDCSPSETGGRETGFSSLVVNWLLTGGRTSRTILLPAPRRGTDVAGKVLSPPGTALLVVVPLAGGMAVPGLMA